MCNNEDESFLKNCVDWFYSFTDSIESEFEENDSLQKLEKSIAIAKEKDTNHRLITKTLLYLEKSFKKTLHMFSSRHYKHLFCGDVSDNCWMESDNSSMKRLWKGPKPQNDLHISQRNIMSFGEERIMNRNSNAMHSLSQITTEGKFGNSI